MHTPNHVHGYIPVGYTLVFPSRLNTLGSAAVHCQLHTLTDLRLFDTIRMANSDTLE